MKRAASLIACLLLPIGFATNGAEATTAPAADKPAMLRLADVLESVESHYPLLAVALEERALADARLLSKQGAFDLRVGLRSKLKPEGYYDTYQGGAFVEQPTTLWGVELFGDYRLGRGDFAVWDGGEETNKGGEFRLGLRLPLLRGRDIDDRRAALRRAEIDAAAADPIIRESLIAFERGASYAYWNWVASGMRVEVARQLLEVAEQRQAQLTRRVEHGAMPTITLADNERLIVARRVLLISAERAFEQAANDLSLFLRDADGNPHIALAERLPRQFPAEDRPMAERVAEDIERAFAQQPILQEYDFKEKKAEVDLALAENRILPDLGLSIAGSKDVGDAVKSPDDKGPAVLEARVELQLPVQRREAHGQVAAARARLRQIRAEQRFARDRIAADVKNAMAALRAAYDQVGAARRNLELAQQLRGAEERKLLLGNSNLIDVNIRELQAFDAGSGLIAAQADYFRAHASYRAALGETRASSAPAPPRPAP